MSTIKHKLCTCNLTASQPLIWIIWIFLTFKYEASLFIKKKTKNTSHFSF